MKIHLQKWGYSFLPHHLLSRTIGWFCRVETPWFRSRLIRWFIRKYRVDMSLALDPNPDHYKTFNAFFTRQLQAEARPICEIENAVVSPADGIISQFGDIQAAKLLQAKGADYSLAALLAEQNDEVQSFASGQFMTIYLAPKDYHRVHIPFAGRLLRMVYVPGRLYSVNAFSSTYIPGLFTRNERVIFWFETSFGPMAVIMVGAMLVASIHTVWSGLVCPQSSRKIQITEYTEKNVYFNKGDELGHFELGSTVIMCFPKLLSWQSELAVGSTVQMGQLLAEVQTS